MIIIKLGKEYSFCMNGKIITLSDLNLPKQFESLKDAKNYMDGYNDARSECGNDPLTNYEFIEL